MRLKFGLIFGALSVAAASQAVWFTNEGDFIAALTGLYFYEDFEGLPGSLGFSLDSKDLHGNAEVNGFSWTVSEASVGLFTLDSGFNKALSTVGEDDPLIWDFTGSTKTVTAFGGYLFNTDELGGSIAGELSLTLRSGTISWSPSGAQAAPTFLGWVGTESIETATLYTFGGTQNYVAADNVIVGQKLNPVPEPFTMGLGLAAAGVFVRRRTTRKA